MSDNLVICVPKKKRRNRSVSLNNPNNIETIQNVNSFLQNLKDSLYKNHQHHIIAEFNLNNISDKVCELCNVGKEFRRKALKVENSKIKPKSVVSKTKKFECDSFLISMIRRVTQDFYAKKQYPTLHLLWKKCLENSEFPKISKSLFHQWLIRKCKFKYRKINKKPVYLERSDIVAQREKYLREIKFYRENNYNIYYSDETWASPDQARNRNWQMLINDSEFRGLKDFWSGQVLRDMNGWTGGFLLKSGHGRVIINHIGNEQGFLLGGDDIFISKKDTKDYHGNMNHVRYLQWFQKILQLVPTKSVLVLDQAPYHKKRVEGTSMPNMSWLKQAIIDWIIAKEIPLPDNVSNFSMLTKPSLIELSKLKPVKPKYIVEQLAEDSGKDIKILWLPPAHCELNPIEIIWSLVKGNISKNNTGVNIQGILDLSKNAISTITPDIWSNCVKHAIKYEQILWDRDRLIDHNHSNLFSSVNPIIIPLYDDVLTESESSDDSNQSSEDETS